MARFVTQDLTCTGRGRLRKVYLGREGKRIEGTNGENRLPGFAGMPNREGGEDGMGGGRAIVQYLHIWYVYLISALHPW